MSDQNEIEQEQYRNMHCRMYENKYPKKNEIVYVSNIQIINQSIKHIVQNQRINRKWSICIPFRIRWNQRFAF